MRRRTTGFKWFTFITAVLGCAMFNVSGQEASFPGRGGRGRGGAAASDAIDITTASSFNPAQVARGQALFKTSCASCHGDDGRGGDGKAEIDLIRSPMVLDDVGGQEIGDFLKYGRPEKNMPAFTSLSQEQVADIAAYLHRSIAAAGERFYYKKVNVFSGNAKAGEVFFNGSVGKCYTCHSANGDMKGLAAKNHDDAPTIQALIINGGSRFSYGRGGRGGGDSSTAITATVTLKSGEKVTGAPVLANDFVITIRLPNDQTRSWLRDGEWPQYVTTDPLQAHKDLALKYTDDDIHNLAAYLETLK